MHCVPCTIYPVPYTLSYTLNTIPCTLHPIPCTLYPVRCTLYPVTDTRNTAAFTLHPTPHSTQDLVEFQQPGTHPRLTKWLTFLRVKPRFGSHRHYQQSTGIITMSVAVTAMVTMAVASKAMLPMTPTMAEGSCPTDSYYGRGFLPH